MNSAPIDMSGVRIGRVDVIEQARGGLRGAHWRCVCLDCRAEFVRYGRRLRRAEDDPALAAELHRCWGAQG
jgi:hypothetical protein